MDAEGNFPESDFEIDGTQAPSNAYVFSEVSDDTIFLIQNLQEKYQASNRQTRKVEEVETNPILYIGLIAAAFVVGKFL